MTDFWKALITIGVTAVVSLVMLPARSQTAPDSFPGGQYNSSAPSLTNGQPARLQMDASGNLKINPATTGQVSGTVNLQAATVGGCTPTYFQTAATSNSTLIKTGQTTLCSLSATTTGTTVNYVKLYDNATAPTCQTTAVKGTYAISSTAQLANPVPTFGLNFASGLGVCVTGQVTATDSSAGLAGATINFGYK